MKDFLFLVLAMAVLASCGRTAGVPDTGADGAADAVTSDDAPLDTTGPESDLSDAETADAPPSDPDAPDPEVAEDAGEPDEAPDDTEGAIGDVTADVPDDATGAADLAADLAAEPGSDPFPSGLCAKKNATWSRKVLHVGGVVTFNEVMYHHPPKTLPDGTAEASPEEWIELFNRGPVDVDVGGWQLPDEVEFEIEVPAGASLYLRTHEPNMGFIDGLGPVFTANADAFQVLVLVQEKLADTLMGAWDIDWSDGKGLVAGITAVIDPDGPTLFPEFVGGAQVTIAPLVEDPDYKFVYLDSKNPANTTLTATDPEQPLFFAANVPPRAASDPYHANVAHETYPFGDTAFVVEPGTLTYLPMSPKK